MGLKIQLGGHIALVEVFKDIACVVVAKSEHQDLVRVFKVRTGNKLLQHAIQGDPRACWIQQTQTLEHVKHVCKLFAGPEQSLEHLLAQASLETTQEVEEAQLGELGARRFLSQHAEHCLDAVELRFQTLFD